jgi:hypothetical protein
MFVNSPAGTFAPEAIEAFAPAQMTEDGKEVDMIPVEPPQRSRTRVFCRKCLHE